MAITCTNTIQGRRKVLLQGGSHAGPRYGFSDLAGLAEGANIIPHGLPFTPNRMISLRPGAAGKWGETAVPDSTNFYVTVGAGGSVLGRVN